MKWPRAQLARFRDERVLDVPLRVGVFLLLTIAATSIALGLRAWDGRTVRAIDGFALDNYFAWRGSASASDVSQKLPHTRDIILIETKHALPRPLLAKLLGQLRGAKVVAFDMMFLDAEAQLESDELSPQEKFAWYGKELGQWRRDNAAFARDVKRQGRVVLGLWPEEIRSQNAITSSTRTSTRSAIKDKDDALFSWRKPPLVMWSAARYHAHLLVQPDVQDGVCRGVQLRDGNPTSPALGLALAAASLGISPAELRQKMRAMNADGGVLQLGSRRVRYGRDGAIAIDFVGNRQSFDESRVVYQRVLDGTYDAQDFAGKIVIIGEASTSSKEILPTPFGEMPGMQIHANVAATLLSEIGPPQTVSFASLFLISLFSCLLLVLPLWRFPLWTSFAVAPFLLLGLFFGGAQLFASRHVIAPLSVPLIAIFLTLNALALAEYARARATLGAFIGSEMLPQTMGLLSRLRLGGRTEDATAWFCDLRGFSTISEGRAPQVVTQFLERYTELLVEVVHRHGGRPIDYQGDGVFVLFESKIAGENFAVRAVAAALEMQHQMNALRDELQSEGLDAGEISIGIATGPMMIGMVGSRSHMKMGAVGDTVNIASRVQNLSFRCGRTILLTKSTHILVCESYRTEFCGIYPVRGRVEPLPIYAVLGATGPNIEYSK